MNHVLAIAKNTYREAVRNKVFYIVLAFALFVLGVSIMLATLALDEHIRLVKHFGLFSINLFGLLLAMFIGANLIYEELERRTIYVLVAHGVPRYAFVLGKFLGLAMTVTAVTVIMGLLFLLILVSTGGGAYIDWVLYYAMLLSLLRMMIVIALALLFSSFSTPVLAAVLTLMMYIIGNNSGTLREVVNYKHREGEWVGEYVARTVYALVPDLGRYDIMTWVSYGHQVQVEPEIFLLGLAWIGVFLLLAIAGFSVRDFK